jgi:hypothetical protein
MLHYVLVMAMWDGSEAAVRESEFIFRKQEVCQLVAQKLMLKHPQIKAYRCVKRHKV